MSRATTRELVDDAVSRSGAVLAFNVITLEHAEGIVTGAEAAGAPVLLQFSENAIRFHGGRFAPLLAACDRLADESAVPVSLHLDHIQDAELAEQLILRAGDVGATSIMVDEAHHDYAQNVARTRASTEHAHRRGLWVEAELGAIGGKDGAHARGVRTDPAEAASFVAATGVDALAVAVGSSHAMTTADAQLDLGLISELARAVPVPLVLHGSSGVPVEMLAEAISAGIRKINVGTALNVAFTGRVRSFLDADSAATDPRRYLAHGRDGIAETVAALCEQLIAPIPTTFEGAR
ncbi:class II fructose-bisphosphate aldolase [Leifsonia sp. NPDC056665]|uniref:class II fructose-bisphosphate aldolase n=1 Tax=Leifsonia sp. NPDC056665 TaxID=3345901 RepID=UPI0036CE0BDC